MIQVCGAQSTRVTWQSDSVLGLQSARGVDSGQYRSRSAIETKDAFTNRRRPAMRGMGPRQRLRFVTVLIVLPLFMSGISYCLINEFTGSPPCGARTEGPACSEHSNGALPSHHHDGAPTRPPPSGSTHPCCTSLVGVVVLKPFGPATTQSEQAAAVLVQANATLLHATSWHGRHAIPTERISSSLHRSPSATRAPPLS